MAALAIPMVPQSDAEAWKQVRIGKITASRVADIVAKQKSGKPSASRANYMAELVVERLTGQCAENPYQSRDMQNGVEREAIARSMYELLHDVEGAPGGFVLHPRLPYAGASPDVMLPCGRGQLEIKCPKTATHIETVLTERVPGNYHTQMQWQLACTDRDWCDYVSFDPFLPADMQLFIKRVARDNDLIRDLEHEVEAFNAEVEATIAELIEKCRRG